MSFSLHLRQLCGHLEIGMAADDRAPLLASMTDEVGRKVLAHNYDQTLALTLQQAEGVKALDSQQRFMQALSAKGKLDRKVEGLPNDARVKEMMTAGVPLARPELAVLTAYAKLELSDDIVASAAPEDPLRLLSTCTPPVGLISKSSTPPASRFFRWLA